jgi:hypothetical protein
MAFRPPMRRRISASSGSGGVMGDVGLASTAPILNVQPDDADLAGSSLMVSNSSETGRSARNCLP